MSSILRALKKLDQEAHEGEGKAEQVRMRQIVNRRAQTVTQLNRLLFVGVLVVATVAVLWFVVPLFHSTNPKSGPTTKPVANTAGDSAHLSVPPVIPVESQVPVSPNPPQVTHPITQPGTQPGTQPITRPITKPAPQPVTQSIAKPAPSPLQIPATTIPKQFTLTGILWSELQERRVAMIDDRYLKEGETIEGVTVITIKKKTVTLKYKEKTWTITLKK